jgi:hypothetical protein
MTSAHGARGAELYVVDHVAGATLQATALARYTAYRTALIADEQDSGRVIELLSLFIWELREGCSANGVH